MRGLVKVSRQKAAQERGAKPTAARNSGSGAKRATAKTADQKATRKSAAGVPRKSGAAATATARKAAAKRSDTKAIAAPARKAAAQKPVARKANGTAAVMAKAAKPATRPAEANPSAGTRTRTAATPQPAANDLEKPVIDQAARDKALAREAGTIAVTRALSLLETLARTGPVPMPVLADAAGCGKAAALELLAAMQSRNFVIQDEARGVWQLGARWGVLGSAANEQGALAATAMPYLAALGNATGENVYLRVREGMECETVAIYQTDPGLRVYTEVGKKMPLHAGSGRLLLAHAPEAVQTQVLAQRLQHYTPSTRTDPSWIAADLHRIRQRGFLITDSEVVAGTVSVCAPVRDASGQVVAALLIGSPSLRMRPPRPRALMPIVVEAARKLSHALGSISGEPATPAPANGSVEGRQLGAFTGPAWSATALGAAISRPHSIFR
jgi:IclR family transcriptional regulator, KDG regulon repressor